MSSSNTGSKSDLYPEQIRFEEANACRRRSTFEKSLIFLSFVLFILAFIFIILFVVFYTKAQDVDEDKVCKSRDCVLAASKLAAKMDLTADPCEDFAQYACGGFYKDNVIPDDNDRINSFSVVNDDNNQVLRLMLEEDMQTGDPGYVKKMKMLYRSCLDEDKIEEIGLTPYTSNVLSKDWPTTNPKWDPSTFDVNAMIQKYQSVFVEPIFIYTVSYDLDDSNKYKLNLGQPNLVLSLKILMLPRNDTHMMAYQQLYEDMAVALGADRAIAQKDAEELIDFNIELAKIQVTQEEAIDLSTLNNPSTIANMTKQYPYIDFHKSIQAAFDTIDLEIPEDLPIVNKHPKYFSKLNDVLQATDKRVIQNHFGIAYAIPHVLAYTKEMREILRKYQQTISGSKTEQPRWRYCIDTTTSLFGKGVGKTFVKQTFSEDSKNYMNAMIDNLESVFHGLLKEANWMHPKTKEAAFLKLNNLGRKIGYPDKDFTDADIGRFYENYTVWDGEFFKTKQDASVQLNKVGLRLLYDTVDKDQWQMNPSTVNAYFSGQLNEMGFPAGILQPPFYSEQNPNSVNFGGIGAIIGHEITHGFDRSGSQFDHLGNIKNWWQTEDHKEFQKRTQCVIDQYSAFKVKEVDMNLNGKLTAGENAADIGGLKEAYRAYKKYSDSHSEELPLPGIGLTTDQQFFLAFSQLWCTKRTKASFKSKVLNSVHSPGRYRIIGPLHNNEDFGRVFGCPAGSPMNPVDKCVVW